MNNPGNLWKVGPGGIVIQINTNDPDTPALVWDSIKKRHSATYDCAMDTGELDCGAGPELTAEQTRWLEQFRNHVDAAYDYARKDLPEYK